MRCLTVRAPAAWQVLRTMLVQLFAALAARTSLYRYDRPGLVQHRGSVGDFRRAREVRRCHLGETGPLSQGVQAGRKTLRIRYINGMGVQVSPLNPLSVAPWLPPKMAPCWPRPGGAAACSETAGPLFMYIAMNRRCHPNAAGHGLVVPLLARCWPAADPAPRVVNRRGWCSRPSAASASRCAPGAAAAVTQGVPEGPT
jgi:hypothetical protein